MITLHPSIFDHKDWQNQVSQLEESTDCTVIAERSQEYAHLIPNEHAQLTQEALA